MGLDKAIKYGKEYRKPYRRGKAIDPACRNHGRCSWCVSNRTIQTQREAAKADIDTPEYPA